MGEQQRTSAGEEWILLLLLVSLLVFTLIGIDKVIQEKRAPTNRGSSPTTTEILGQTGQ